MRALSPHQSYPKSNHLSLLRLKEKHHYDEVSIGRQPTLLNADSPLPSFQSLLLRRDCDLETGSFLPIRMCIPLSYSIDTLLTPQYTNSMAPHAEGLKMLRIVCRMDFSRSRAAARECNQSPMKCGRYANAGGTKWSVTLNQFALSSTRKIRRPLLLGSRIIKTQRKPMPRHEELLT